LIPGTDKGFFSFTKHPDQLWAYPMGMSSYFPKDKAAGHEDDHSSPSNVKVQNLHYPLCLHGMHRNNFILQ
jgi:hypothetical protein